MQAPHQNPGTTVARLPASSDFHHALHLGVAIERVRCVPHDGFVEVRAPVEVVAGALVAVRALRTDIRDARHGLTLTQNETARALKRVNGGRRLQAVGALHRGEPTGFTLVLRDGTYAEWRLRPVRFLSLTPANCADRDVQPR